ncbi:protein kinase [Dorcoceras hygrometricum]|uniref:Protein kinase n=1 Tax=Dorcoceras hygrometricum TaxID=472368 RepID=A0A2Z7B918_9LAMI|nr:protein kinase [Dorcoceras hygrometricum]
MGSVVVLRWWMMRRRIDVRGTMHSVAFQILPVLSDQLSACFVPDSSVSIVECYALLGIRIVQAVSCCVALSAWLRPVSRGNRHFTVGGGRLRQSDPRPEWRLLRQPALEGLTRSARTNSPRQVGRNKFRRERRRRPRQAAAAAA